MTAFEEKANAIEITDNANAKFHVYASSKEEFELWLDALKVHPTAKPHLLHPLTIHQAAQQSYQPVQGTVRRGTVVTAPSWSNIASAVPAIVFCMYLMRSHLSMNPLQGQGR